jgi:MFS superfamily sulfate permease-like transporter
VVIGVVYAIYFLIKHTLEAGYVLKERFEGHTKRYTVELALNVSFINKKRITEMLDKLPEYAVVEINGADSVYIDNDILEIFHDFKSKAHRKHIQLTMINIPDVETIELH